MYRTNYGLNKLMEHVSHNCSFPNGAKAHCLEKKKITILSDLFCVCFLVQLGYVGPIMVLTSSKSMVHKMCNFFSKRRPMNKFNVMLLYLRLFEYIVFC